MNETLQVFDKILGDKMRQLRIVNGLTQQDVAEMLGVTFQQVQKYEKGINRMTVRTLYVLSTCFNVAIEEFFKDILRGRADTHNVNHPRAEMMRNFNQLSKEQVDTLLRIIAAFGCVNNRKMEEA